MGVYRGWLVYCHSRPVVTCWAPTVGRRDMTINTAPSMICHSSHITQLLHKAAKNISDIVFLQGNLVEFGSAQLRHHMVDTENEFDSNGRCPGTVILQEGHLSGVNITRKRPMTRWEGFSEHVFASLASITWSKISDQELFGHREVSHGHMVPWPGYHCHLCVIWSVVILSIFKTLRFSLRRWWSCGNTLLWPTKNIRKYMRGHMMLSLGVKLCTSTRERSD